MVPRGSRQASVPLFSSSFFVGPHHQKTTGEKTQRCRRRRRSGKTTILSTTHLGQTAAIGVSSLGGENQPPRGDFVIIQEEQYLEEQAAFIRPSNDLPVLLRRLFVWGVLIRSLE
jgi:hypothetical protein